MMDIDKLNPIINTICQGLGNTGDFCCLICGSSLHQDSPRDVDLMLYIQGDLTVAANQLKALLEIEYSRVSIAWLPIYSLYSLKFIYNQIEISIHAVSFSFIEESISFATDADYFAGLDIFCQDLKWPVVWRYWIRETSFCAGNQALQVKLLESLKKAHIPYLDIQRKLAARIWNQISYYRHKKQNGGLCQFIIGCQLLNAMLLYCYSINHQLLGTVKYMEQDLNAFTIGGSIVSACRKLNAFICKNGTADLEELINEISEIKEFK